MTSKNYWTPEKQEKLVALWKSGISARLIAEQLGDGVTRNAVIGKANRLGLSQQTKKTPEAAEPEEQNTILSAKQCQWPFGDPNHKNFYFCGKPVVPEWPYCQEHCNEAYRSLNDKEEG